MDQILAHLRSLAPVPDDLADHIRKTWKIREYKKGSFLVKSGIINNQFFFIQQGLVRGYYTKEGKQITLWALKEGDFIASMQSYEQQQPGKENMRALEHCIVGCGTFMELEETLRLFPAFERHARIVTQRYSRLWYTLLYGIRMQSAEERYHFLTEKFPDLLQRVPAKYLASYLDITEVTLSRMRSKR